MQMHPCMRVYATVQKLLCHGNDCELVLSLARASYRLSFAARPATVSTKSVARHCSLKKFVQIHPWRGRRCGVAHASFDHPRWCRPHPVCLWFALETWPRGSLHQKFCFYHFSARVFRNITSFCNFTATWRLIATSLQHDITLQHDVSIATWCLKTPGRSSTLASVRIRPTLHTATRCNTHNTGMLWHVGKRMDKALHTQWNILYCNALQHIATLANVLTRYYTLNVSFIQVNEMFISARLLRNKSRIQLNETIKKFWLKLKKNLSRRKWANICLFKWIEIIKEFLFNEWQMILAYQEEHFGVSVHHSTRGNSLQHTAKHCNTLQHTHEWYSYFGVSALRSTTATHYNTLQHAATHCNALQHTQEWEDCFERFFMLWFLQLIATHCNRLQQTATDCNRLMNLRVIWGCRLAVVSWDHFQCPIAFYSRQLPVYMYIYT